MSYAHEQKTKIRVRLREKEVKKRTARKHDEH